MVNLTLCQLASSTLTNDMLKVTIELFPFGDSSKAREISSFYIANDGTGGRDIGNYIYKKDVADDWQPSVQNWPRSTPVEWLVKSVIEKHFE